MDKNRTEGIKHEIKGAVKETVGKVTGNEELEAEGKLDQGKSGVKQAGESVKDAAKDVKNAFKK